MEKSIQAEDNEDESEEVTSNDPSNSHSDDFLMRNNSNQGRTSARCNWEQFSVQT